MLKREPYIPTVSKLKKLFIQQFPPLLVLAELNKDFVSFKEALKGYLRSALHPETYPVNEPGREAVDRILRLINYDDTEINELSTGQKIRIHTIRYLYDFLRGTQVEEISTDVILDLYHQFMAIKNPVIHLPSQYQVKRQMQRWPTGLKSDVIAIRETNKNRIIGCLVRKIDRRHGSSSRYQFAEGMSAEEKYRQVEEWWQNARFHLSLAVKSPTELNAFLDNSLSAETMKLLYQAKKKGMPFLSLLITSLY